MAGKFITIAAKGGGKFRAYVATPPGGKGPGLLLLQEIFGINAHVRHLADRYAEEGYLCVAPDLFWRMKPGVDLGSTNIASSRPSTTISASTSISRSRTSRRLCAR